MATINVVTQDRHVQSLTAALRAADPASKQELLLALGIGSTAAQGGMVTYANGIRLPHSTRVSMAQYTCPKDGVISVNWNYWCTTNQAMMVAFTIARIRKNSEYVCSNPGIFFRKENVIEPQGLLLGAQVSIAYLPVVAGDIIHGIGELGLGMGQSANAYQSAGQGDDGLSVSYQ